MGTRVRVGTVGWLRHRVSAWEVELQREATMSLNACPAMYQVTYRQFISSPRLNFSINKMRGTVSTSRVFMRVK